MMKQSMTTGLLIALLCLSVSCGNQSQMIDNTTNNHEQNGETSIFQETETTPFGLPALDFGGETVNVLCRTSNMVEWANELYVPEDDGDIVNSAVFARNLHVEEALGVELNYIEMNGTWDVMNKFMNAIRNSINAGDQAYDLIASYRHYMPQLATEGYFANLHDVPYLNFDQPWWKGNFVSELTIDGKLHFMAGDIGNSMLKAMLVMFYNKDLAAQWDLEDIYSLVNEGKWTIDKAIEISSLVSADLNGDGKMKMEDDLYALSTNHCQEFFDVLESPFTVMNAEGIPTLAFNNEKTVTIIDQLCRLFYETGAVPYSESSSVGWEQSLDMFLENRLLIWAHCLGYAESMRDMTEDFAVIPYFKYDENQESYQTAVQNNFTIFSIAVNCDSKEVVGAVTEALAAEGYTSVTPAYYEMALGTKYMRDDQSVKMLELIRNGVTFNFGTIYSIQLDNIYNTMPEILKKKKNDFTSYYAARESKWNQLLSDIITAYQEMES